jgi:hypothetical protein
MCITWPKVEGLGTGFVFRFVLRRVAKSPMSRIASAGVLSNLTVGQYNSEKCFLIVSILRKPKLARRKSSETDNIFEIDDDGLSTEWIIGI